jgi:RNA polymerase sigma factor (sigma-70 family)
MTALPDFPDLELLRRYRRTGCAEAFRALVERHGGMVCATARRILGNDLWAQDVMQTVFVDLARKGRALPDSIVPGAWLYRAACRHALNRSRSEQRRQRRAAEHLAMNEAQSPDQAWQAMMPHVDEALLSLRQTDRAALVLRFLENQPLREVGLALGTSEDTAQKRVNRALTKLRTLLLRRSVKISAAMLGSAALRQSVEASAPLVMPAPVASTALSAGSGNASLVTAVICNARAALIAAAAASLVCGIAWQRLADAANTRAPAASASAAGDGSPSKSKAAGRSGSSGQFPQLIPPATAEEAVALMLRLETLPDNHLTQLHKSWLASSAVLSHLPAARLAELLENSRNEKVQSTYGPLVFSMLSMSDPADATRRSLRFPMSWFRSVTNSCFTAWTGRDAGAAFQWLFTEGMSHPLLSAPPPRQSGQIRGKASDEHPYWLAMLADAVSAPLSGFTADIAAVAARIAQVPQAFRRQLLAVDLNFGILPYSYDTEKKLRAHFTAAAAIADPEIRAGVERSIVAAYLSNQPDIREAEAMLAKVYPGGGEALDPVRFVVGIEYKKVRRGRAGRPAFRPSAAQAALDSAPDDTKSERLREITAAVMEQAPSGDHTVTELEHWLDSLPPETQGIDAARATVFKRSLAAGGGFLDRIFHTRLPVQDPVLHDALICGWVQLLAQKGDREMLQYNLREGAAAKSWSPALRERVALIISTPSAARE